MVGSAQPWHIWVEGWALQSGGVPEVVVGGSLSFALHVVVDHHDHDVEMLSTPPPSPRARFLGVHTSYEITAKITARAGRACILDVGLPAFCDRRALPETAAPGSWVRLVGGLEVDPTRDLYRAGAREEAQRAVARNWLVQEIWLDATPRRLVDWGDEAYPRWLPDEGPVSVAAGPETWRDVQSTLPNKDRRRQGYKLVCHLQPPPKQQP